MNRNALPNTTRNERGLAVGVGLAIAGTLGFAGLAGCGLSPEEQASNAKVQVTTYKGEDLYCRVMEVGGSTNKNYTCDFDGYYRGNPDVPADTPRIPEGILKVVQGEFNGKPLDCLTFPTNNKYDGQTCDFAGMHIAIETTESTEPVPIPSVADPSPIQTYGFN
jgi:hypothetical protein